MASTVVLKSPPLTGVSAHTSGRCRKHDCVYDPSAIAGGTTAGRQTRCPEQPLHARALCGSFLFAGGTPGRRDSSSEARRCETNETFRDTDILARPRLSTRILDSCATRVKWVPGGTSWASSGVQNRVFVRFGTVCVPTHGPRIDRGTDGLLAFEGSDGWSNSRTKR
jgi:hypothetical protein